MATSTTSAAATAVGVAGTTKTRSPMDPRAAPSLLVVVVGFSKRVLPMNIHRVKVDSIDLFPIYLSTPIFLVGIGSDVAMTRSHLQHHLFGTLAVSFCRNSNSTFQEVKVVAKVMMRSSLFYQHRIFSVDSQRSSLKRNLRAAVEGEKLTGTKNERRKQRQEHAAGPKKMRDAKIKARARRGALGLLIAGRKRRKTQNLRVPKINVPNFLDFLLSCSPPTPKLSMVLFPA